MPNGGYSETLGLIYQPKGVVGESDRCNNRGWTSLVVFFWAKAGMAPPVKSPMEMRMRVGTRVDVVDRVTVFQTMYGMPPMCSCVALSPESYL